mgnify:CR=1 FL=1
MMQRLLKQRVMNGIRARGAHGDKWREMLPGQTDVLLMMDEAHLLLTSDDVLLFSTSRSLGLMPVIAVQGPKARDLIAHGPGLLHGDATQDVVGLRP